MTAQKESESCTVVSFSKRKHKIISIKSFLYTVFYIALVLNVEASLSKKENKALEKLESINVTKSEMKILFYLFKTNSGLARIIERVTELRQPEVSMATITLMRRGWLKKTTVETPGKGRPQNKYSLAKPKKEIIESMDNLFVEKIKALENERQEFKEMIGGIK